MEKVSVCMTTYNGEKYVRAQIESVLVQLGEDDELVICDDKSSDQTIEIIRQIQDHRVHIFENEKNLGYTANFENGLKKCTGDYIFLCDQDDIWLENKIEKVKKCLENYDFVMTNAKVVDANLNVLEESRNAFYRVQNGFWRNFIKTRYLGCCMAFKRCVLEYALPFPLNNELCKHDAWISLCAEMCFKTKVLDEPLILYRRHESNVSTGGSTHSSLGKIIKIRAYLFMNLIKRRLKRNKSNI